MNTLPEQKMSFYQAFKHQLSLWFDRKSMTWLLCSLGVFLISLVLWAVLQAKQNKASNTLLLTGDLTAQLPDQSLSTPEIDRSKTVDLGPALGFQNKIAFPATLGFFSHIVQIFERDMTKPVYSKEDHGPEFKGRSFITQYSKNWTVELMRVSEESVLISYLSKKSDHDKYQYFMLREANKGTKYVLTYGNFSSVQTAAGAIASYNFTVPNKVKPVPIRFDSYKAFVADSNADERLIDRVARQYRKVVLNHVSSRPVEAQPKRVKPQQNTDNSSPVVKKKEVVTRKEESSSSRTHTGEAKPEVVETPKHEPIEREVQPDVISPELPPSEISD